MLKIKLDPGAFCPTRAHEGDGGLDLYATETKTIPPYSSGKFDTGVHVKLPPYTAGLLVAKSGLNFNHDLLSDGLIDVGYTGSIKVKLYNQGPNPYTVRKGDKISQLVIVDIHLPHIQVVDDLEETDRGDDGFGSTGR